MSQGTAGAAELSPLEWRVEPWRQSLSAVAVVGALFAAVLLHAALVVGDGLFVGLTLVAAAYVLAPVLLPVRYRLDAAGLTRVSPFAKRTLEWKRFSGYRVGPAGRTIILHYGGRGLGWLRGGVTLFLPDAALVSSVSERLAAWMGAGREER